MPVTGDWQAAYGGLDLGAGTPYRIQPPVEGLDMPPVVVSDQDKLRDHGQYPGDDFLGPRSTVWAFKIAADDRATFTAQQSTLRAAFRPCEDERPMTFQLPGVAGGGMRRILCRPRRRSDPVALTHAISRTVVTVQLDASDPRIYDDTESSVSTGLASSAVGLTWPLTWPLNFGGASTSGTVTAANAGDFSTPWTAVITGPVTNPSIENVDTGDQLIFTANGGLVLASGDTLVVDSATKTALLNGTASRYDRLASPVSWWDLEPGDNHLRFGGTTSGSPTMTVTWRSAWI